MTVHAQNMFANINCAEFFYMNWQLWQCLGIICPQPSAKNPDKRPRRYSVRCRYLLWSYFLNLTATCMFPLHLFLAIFDPAANQSQLFESVAIFTTSLEASFKMLLFGFNIKNVIKMKKVLQALDQHIHHAADKLYAAKHMARTIIYMERTYVIVYAGVGIFAGLACIVRGEQKLIYPGWFPFDWKQSWWHFSAAICFQIHGIVFQIMQNLSSDSFSPKALCILTGHIKLLYRRVARIGYDETISMAEHEAELNKCILHQKNLYELFHIIQTIISWPIFLQLFASLTNVGVAMVALILFVNDIFYQIYYVIYFAAMMLQLLPVCYYGSAFVSLFEHLHYAVFSCNWTGQTKTFKRHMILFTERSLKLNRAMAGGMFPIHLTTFFATCKGAYSMFTVLITVK